MVPLPLVGDAETVYVDLNASPETGPPGSPISSAPDILPVGEAPSAVNTLENTTTPKSTGLVANPAYVPFSALLANDSAAWGSPNPNKTLASDTNRKI